MKQEPKHPHGVKISRAIKSSVLWGKKGKSEKLNKNCFATKQATLGLGTGGENDLKLEKEGKKHLETGGSYSNTYQEVGPPRGWRIRKGPRPNYPGTQIPSLFFFVCFLSCVHCF